MTFRPNPAAGEQRQLIRGILRGSPIQTNAADSSTGTAGEVGRIQRKLAVHSGVSLDPYFTGKKVKTTQSDGTYTNPGDTSSDLGNQILIDLLASPRSFVVKGTTSAEAEANLDAHKKARSGIVTFASKKKYSFGAGKHARMNPTYWTVDSTSYDMLPTITDRKDRLAALNDVNVNPDKYAIGCEAATKITVLGGSNGADLYDDWGVSEKDWIIGDWGYISNTKAHAKTKAGLEGENLIYVGWGKFWGHFSSGTTYRSLSDWFKQVESWDGGAAIADWRTRPGTGLEE